MKRTLLIGVFLAVAGMALGQPYQEALVHMRGLLQYQLQKQRAIEKGKLTSFHVQPFRNMGLERIPARKVLDDGDPRHIWGFQVKGNGEYDKAKQPLHQLFVHRHWGSIVAVDHFSADDSICELYFWGKKYYRRFSTELRKMGFAIRQSSSQQNVLEFRREETTIGVDVIIWPEIYILQIKSL